MLISACRVLVRVGPPQQEPARSPAPLMHAGSSRTVTSSESWPFGIEGVAPHYRLIVERAGPLDELTLECEPVPGVDGDALGVRVARPLRPSPPSPLLVRICPWEGSRRAKVAVSSKG